VTQIDHTHVNSWRTLVLRGIPKSAGNALDQLIRFNRFIRSSKPHLQFPSPEPRESRAKARLLRQLLISARKSWRAICFEHSEDAAPHGAETQAVRHALGPRSLDKHATEMRSAEIPIAACEGPWLLACFRVVGLVRRLPCLR